MPKDTRLYAPITVSLASHHKIAPLTDAAFRAFIEMILWSREHMSDGHIPEGYAIHRWGKPVLDELQRNDPERPSLQQTINGYVIHDFAEHQVTNGDLDDLSEKRKRAAQARWDKQKRCKPDASAMQVQCKTMPETETETETEITTYVDKEQSRNVAPRKSAPHGTRLPEGWYPSQHVIDAIKAEYPHLDLRREHDDFCDYWLAKTGKDATKRDWDRTWRRWMRKQGEEQPGRRRTSGIEAKMAGYQAMKTPDGNRPLGELFAEGDVRAIEE